jgi:hypothetical protein
MGYVNVGMEPSITLIFLHRFKGFGSIVNIELRYLVKQEHS